jgi:hypothetical protein
MIVSVPPGENVMVLALMVLALMVLALMVRVWLDCLARVTIPSRRIHGEPPLQRFRRADRFYDPAGLIPATIRPGQFM